MPFSKENWFHSFFLWSVWIFFTKLVQAHCTWRPNRLRDFPGEKLLLSRVSNWIKMGQNAIEDAILASFHIINIVKLSSRRGIYKNGMTTGLCSSTVVDSSSTFGVPLELQVSFQLYWSDIFLSLCDYSYSEIWIGCLQNNRQIHTLGLTLSLRQFSLWTLDFIWRKKFKKYIC